MVTAIWNRIFQPHSNVVRIVHRARDYWFEERMGCKFAGQASAPQFSCAVPLPPLSHVHLYLYMCELGSLPRSEPYRVRSSSQVGKATHGILALHLRRMGGT